MALLRSSRLKQSSAGLTVAELAKHIPDDIRRNITRPLYRLPLRLSETPPVESLRQAAAGSTLRFAGVMTGFNPETGYARITPYGGGSETTITQGIDPGFAVNLGKEHGSKIATLSGLILDTTIEVPGNPEDDKSERGPSLLFHGIERPVALGDTEGLLRCQVVEVERSPSGVVEIVGVVGEKRDYLRVGANSSCDNGDWKEGNVLALRVTAGSQSGYFVQDKLPMPPLTPTVLLAEGVPIE
jgi:hypothetical protein